MTDEEAQCYLNRYADLQKAFGANNIAEAKKHWLEHGKKENRDRSCSNSNQGNTPSQPQSATTGAEIPQNLRESMSRYVDDKIKDLDGKFNKYVCTEIGRHPQHRRCWDDKGNQ